jgi:hypothetical protein
MEFLDKLLGGINTIDFCVYTIWGFIGMSLQMLADVSKRKDKTTELSWKLWCKENIKRLGFQLLLIPVAVVLFITLFNKELNIMNACSIGFSIDFIWDLLNKKASFNKK